MLRGGGQVDAMCSAVFCAQFSFRAGLFGAFGAFGAFGFAVRTPFLTRLCVTFALSLTRALVFFFDPWLQAASGLCKPVPRRINGTGPEIYYPYSGADATFKEPFSPGYAVQLFAAALAPGGKHGRLPAGTP